MAVLHEAQRPLGGGGGPLDELQDLRHHDRLFERKGRAGVQDANARDDVRLLHSPRSVSVP